MKEIKVLGSGCPSCVATAKLFEQNARELDIDVTVEKVTDIAEIMGWGVMRTPGVVVDGALVHAGGVPRREQVRAWLAS